MKIDVLTLFPSMYDNFINESIIKRAIEKKQVEINIHNIRDYMLYFVYILYLMVSSLLLMCFLSLEHLWL